MSNIQNVLITFSLTIWFVLIVLELFQYKKKYLFPFGIQFLLIIVLPSILHRYLGYFNTIAIKGGVSLEESWILIGLYIATILGILSQHIFIQIKGLEEKGRQRKLKWMPVIKPLLISPIIFLGILNQLEQVGAKTTATTLQPVITQCILAFQNGFFWKTIIEQFEKQKD